MARRRNSVSKRFAKMRGLPPGEKALMQRIGDLMDAALNNRQASNPFEQSTLRENRQIYPPTGLLAQTGISSVKLIWDAANSNEHLYYEVEFVNMTTGERTVKRSYTYTIVFRGTDGTYIAKVSSVGRDGSKSTLKQVEFGIGSDVMLIEGAKHGPTELGTVIQDNMKLYKGFSVYTWGAVILDKQTLDTNNQVIFKLWRSETPDANFDTDQRALQQTITLYSSTESGACLDTTARAGLIVRPSAPRPGSFETSQSVMFSPMAVDDKDDEKIVTYFLQTINRVEEIDEVCLSLTIWAGMDGVGSSVPGDPHLFRSPKIYPHYNSFHKQAPGDQSLFPFDTRDACAVLNDGFTLIGNQWTVALWIRMDSLNATLMADGGDANQSGINGTNFFLSRTPLNDAGNKQSNNAWRFSIGASNLGLGAYRHDINIKVHRNVHGTGFPDDMTNLYTGTANGDSKQFSPLFPWGDAATASTSFWDATNNGWMFMVFCWEGGDFFGGVPKLRFYSNIATAGLGEGGIEPRMALVAPTSDESSDKFLVQDDREQMGYQFDGGGYSKAKGKHDGGVYVGDLNDVQTFNNAYYQLGIWNVALDSDQFSKGWNIGPIETLFNNGRGYAVDWTRNMLIGSGAFAYLNYIQAENLVHLVQFGAVEKAFTSLETLRDTGYYLPGGDLNFTQDLRENDFWENWHETEHTAPPDRFHQKERPGSSGNWYDNLGQSWTRGTDIYDILSPLGTNNTTEYDYAYPGQNMTKEKPFQTGDEDYPDYDTWRAEGADLSRLPWLSGPFPPGYHKDDPDRPIRGGVAG